MSLWKDGEKLCCGGSGVYLDMACQSNLLPLLLGHYIPTCCQGWWGQSMVVLPLRNGGASLLEMPLPLMVVDR